MKLAENLYAGIQGEGPNAGRPSIFIRLSGCNARCRFCDTKYSWGEGKELLTENIIGDIERLQPTHIVITGGEPMLQFDAIRRLIDAIRRLINNFSEPIYELETNGSIVETDMLLFNYISVSPKKELINDKYNSGIEKLARRSNTIFKFVIEDEDNYNMWIKWAHARQIPAEKIWMMPEGRTKTEITKNSKWLIPLLVRDGYRYCSRLQVMIYGKRRGV